MWGHEDSPSLLSKCLVVVYIVSFALTALKTAGFITWSWWVVLFPLWVSAAVVVTFVAGAAMVIVVAELLYLRDRQRWQRQLLQQES